MATVQSITKNRFKVHLHDYTNKVAIIKVIRDRLGLGLREAKDIVECAPCVVDDYDNHDDALRLCDAIDEAGGSSYTEDSAAGRIDETAAKKERRDQVALLYEYAATAMNIYAVADMLSHHVENADKPGPACALIAEQASQLNEHLRSLAERMDGRVPGEYLPPEFQQRFAKLMSDCEETITDRLDDLDYSRLPQTVCDNLLATFTKLGDLLGDEIDRQKGDAA